MFANVRLSGVATRVVLASILAVLPATTAFAQAQTPRAQAPGIDIPFTATAATGEVINATLPFSASCSRAERSSRSAR